MLGLALPTWLSAKLIGSGLIALALGLAVWAIHHSGYSAGVASMQQKLADCQAAQRLQNARIEAEAVQARQQQESASAAAAAGQRGITEARGHADAVRETPNNGCATPANVMGADL